jgi:ABC-type transport system substrate-binding protein
VADLQMRRARIYAIDRQELAATLVTGMSPVAHSFLSPNQVGVAELWRQLRYSVETGQPSSKTPATFGWLIGGNWVAKRRHDG